MTLFRALLVLAVFAGYASADEAPKPTKEERLEAAATENRLVIEFDGETFSGPGYDRLVAEGEAAQFFMIGEEHGIAENPMLAGQLFTDLAGHGYSKLAIEISPPIATLLDSAAKGGMNGIRELFGKPGGQPAFFGMTQEAEMVARARAAVPGDEPVLWGTDYEVGSDRQLLEMLRDVKKPAEAEAAFQALSDASAASYAKYEGTGSPQYLFSFSGDAAIVTAVRDAWPNPDPRSDSALDSLETTLRINNLWMQGKGFESNAARAASLRANFVRHWLDAKAKGQVPKVMAKYGSSHLIRGISNTAVFDMGTLLPAIAELEGGHSFSVMVLPGDGSMTAVMNPSTWTYEPKPAKDGYAHGLEPLMAAAHEDKFTLIDLVPLRSIVGTRRGTLDDNLFRTIHGYDMLLVMSGSTPSRQVELD